MALVTLEEAAAVGGILGPCLSGSRNRPQDVVQDHPSWGPIHCLLQPCLRPTLQSDSLDRACGCDEAVRLHWRD